MALTTRQRSRLYTAIAAAIGTEEAELLLDQFPAREGDELITRDYLAAVIAEVRADIARMENRLYVTLVGLTTVAVGVILTVGR